MTMREVSKYTRPSIVFLRESEPELTGLLGELNSTALESQPGDPSTARARARMESLGPLYRTIRERFGVEVSVEVVDSSSPLSVLLAVLRVARSHGLGWSETLRTLLRLPSSGVLLNGRIASRGEWPSPWELVVRVEELVAASGQRLLADRGRRAVAEHDSWSRGRTAPAVHG